MTKGNGGQFNKSAAKGGTSGGKGPSKGCMTQKALSRIQRVGSRHLDSPTLSSGFYKRAQSDTTPRKIKEFFSRYLIK